MIHKIISTIGLGILGIDPITAVYLLSMGLRNEKKSKITLFFLSFAGFSILGGAILATVFGTAAIDFLKSIMPDDDSPIWAILEFAVSVFILVWVFKRLLQRTKNTDKKEKEAISGNNFKYITTGFVFAVTSFTDPTFYAVILLGGESGNFLTAFVLLTIWFVVSQFMAVIAYIANEINLLDKLVAFVDKMKNKNMKVAANIFYAVLIVVALLLIVDTGFYLFGGRYLF